MIPDRINNPVGWTGILGGVSILIVGALGLADDPDTVNGVTAVLGALVAMFGVRVRAQPPS